MALADSLRQGPPRTQPGPRCSFVPLLKSLPSDEERDALVTMLRDPAWPLTRVIDALEQEYPSMQVPNYSTFQRHRGGKCSCGLVA